MATKVLVPLLGEGVEEVTVIKWLKQEGDSVNELEPLLEVNTDKVDTEIPAPASGTVSRCEPMNNRGLPGDEAGYTPRRLPASSIRADMPARCIQAPRYPCMSRIGGERKVRVVRPGSSEKPARRRQLSTISRALVVDIMTHDTRCRHMGQQQQQVISPVGSE